MSDIVSDEDVERAIHVFNEMDSIIGDLIHNRNFTEAFVQIAEARLADAISDGYQKMPIDKIKWKARASKEFEKAVRDAARADGELGAARIRLQAANSVIEIWRTQQANNRRAHL